jgi:hypothetical protein
MKLFLLALLLFSGCVAQPTGLVTLTSSREVQRVSNGYATATWDENAESDYFMLFFGDRNIGICKDSYQSNERFQNDKVELRRSFYANAQLNFTLRPAQNCGVWDRPLYEQEIVEWST